MLGWLRAEQSGRVITRFRTYKTGALLAYLAYHPRPHPREHLIGMLWPDDTSDAGRNSLSKALSSLRNQLEPPGVPTGTVLRADRATIELNRSACTTDVAEFEAALRAAARADRGSEKGSSTVAAAAAAGAVPLLADAVQLYRGELLPGFYEDWNLAERQRLAETYLAAVLRLIAHLEQIGEVRRAIEYAHQAIRADPLREESHAALIRLYVAAGDQAAALRQYQELERLLEKDVGVPPTRATRALIHNTPSAGAASSAAAAAAAAAIPTATAPSPAPPAWQPFSSLPLGTVSFLLADSETGEEPPPALRDVCRRHGGFEVLTGGNTLIAAFGRATDAVVCAVAGQRALADAPRGVRIVVHTGEAPKDEPGENGASGASVSSVPVLEDATRLLLAAHPGQILCSEATAVLLRRDGEPGLRLVDQGIYRLRGAGGEPERLFEVQYTGRKEQEFPPPQAEAGFKDSLPLLLTRFFGREEELARLSALLQGSQTTGGGQLITLTGPGGTGKTRLSVETARRLLGPFQGAVWFVPLADLWDGRLVIEAIMDSLGIARRPEGAAPTEPLKAVVETLSRQKSLLILDNFEQLLREDDPHAEQAVRTVRTLREQVPSLMILVSSRQRLGLIGEREFPVAPLSTPKAVNDTSAVSDGGMPQEAAVAPETLIRYESVQLFVDRAQAVQPDFQVTTGNAAAVAALCARLEGLPLAVELAAARAQVLTPAQMLAQLENRFQFLVSRQRDATLRHKTLRAAIDWSYRLLSPDLQRFFTRLSVFRGGYTQDAVEAVCGEPDAPGMALDYLSLLVECSLVVADTRSATGASAGDHETRLPMLEMLRHYAQDALPPDERFGIKERHARYFQQLAEKAEAALLGPEQGAWLLRLEAEHDNLRAVLAWSRTEPGAAEIGLRVAAALWRFWWIRGYRSEGREQMAQLLALPQESAPPGVRAKVFAAAGTLARLQGDYEAAVSLLHQALDLQRREGDKQGVASSLNSLGLVSFEQGDYSTARALFEEGLSIFRELGDRKGIAYALNTLGFVFSNQGDYAQARPLFEESLGIRRALGDRQGVASSLNNLGNIPLLEGDYAAAQPLFEESLALKRELGDKQGVPLSLNSLGYLALLQGDAKTAGPLFAESLEIFREMGDKQGVATALNNLGDVAILRGDFAGARPLFMENLGIVREMGDRQGIAYSLEGWARLAAAQGRHERAVRLWAATQSLREAINTPLPPADRAYYNRAVATVRAQMEEAVFAAAWAHGSALSPEEAIIYALADI